MSTPICCFLECKRPAQFVIIEGAGPEDYTEACGKHVKELCGDSFVEVVAIAPQLIPLEGWNRARSLAHRETRSKLPTGLACPMCGAELIEHKHPEVFTSPVPMIRVTCSACGQQHLKVA